MRLRQIVFQRQRLVERINRLLIPPLVIENHATVEVKVRRLGIQHDRLIDALEPLLALSRLKRHQTQQVQRMGIIGLIPEHLAVKLFRFGQPPRPVANHRLLHQFLNLLKIHNPLTEERPSAIVSTICPIGRFQSPLCS